MELALLSLFFLAGGFLRFSHLGALPIDGDNSFHALAAKAILETGRPEMPSGLLYPRAIPLLYLEALSAKIFGFSEWSLALPNATIGTINILLVYRLARNLLEDKLIALTAALLFAFSPLAITIAKMPRMYEAFLMATLVSWLLFHGWYYLKRYWLFPFLLLSALLTISMHEMGILPLLCFTVPMLLEKKWSRPTLVAGITFLGLCGLWLNARHIIFFLYKIQP